MWFLIKLSIYKVTTRTVSCQSYGKSRKSLCSKTVQSNLYYLHLWELGWIVWIIQSSDNQNHYGLLLKFSKEFTKTTFYDPKYWHKSVCLKLLLHLCITNSVILWNCMKEIRSKLIISSSDLFDGKRWWLFNDGKERLWALLINCKRITNNTINSNSCVFFMPCESVVTWSGLGILT